MTQYAERVHLFAKAEKYLETGLSLGEGLWIC
jgi:hypothetical protein